MVESGRFCPACGSALFTPGLADAAQLAAAATALAVPAAPAGSLVGLTIGGDLVIEDVIGAGSFGTVYRGRQLGLDRPVAVKVPSYEIAADPVQARRFAREARAAARIVHPGVVAIYAVGELDDGRPYLAMQLIEGAPLDRILAAGPLPPVRALHVARDIASALSETHAAGVVHRDLKPSNVMWRLDRNGDDRITLVDFGIAVCRPGHADASRLTTNGLVGTPHYMSPELAHGEQVDARADLYALGCLLFELATGTPPFGGSGVEVVLAHLGQPAPRASERRPGVPPAVDRVIEPLLRKHPDQRPANADAVVAMIDDAIAALSDPRSRSRPLTRPGTSVLAAASIRRSRAPRRITVALALLALSGAGFAAIRLRAGEASELRVDEPEPVETPHGAAMAATGEPLRLITRDDGELIVRVLVPEVIHAGVSVPGHLEIKTKLGAPFSVT